MPVGRIFSWLTLRSEWWRQSARRRVGRGVLFFCYSYVGILAVLLCLENWLLYRPSGPGSWQAPPAGLGVEDVWLESADGTAIHAWWAAPSGWQPQHGALLFCHGNGGNLSHRGGGLPFWLHTGKVAVLHFDYPGFGKSGGSPSEAGCYAAADAAYDWLVEQRQVPGKRVILYGGSLGGGVAVDLASRRPHRALLLVSAFTSFPDIAQNRFWFMPARWLVKNRFDNVAKLGQCSMPTYVIHSRADGLIPFEMGRTLYETAPGVKGFHELESEPHHDAGHPAAFEAFLRFLAECEGMTRRDPPKGAR